MGGYVPSWEHYGTHGDSAYPELWDMCCIACMPALGPSGTGQNGTFYNHAGIQPTSQSGTFSASDWVRKDGVWGLQFAALEYFKWENVGFGVMPTRSSEKTIITWRVPVGTGVNMDIGGGFRHRLSATQMLYSDVASITFIGSFSISEGVLITTAVTERGTGGSVVINGYINGIGAPENPHTGLRASDEATQSLSYNSVTQFATNYTSAFLVWNRCLGVDEVKLLSANPLLLFTPRRPRRFYSFAPSFLASWARNNQSAHIGLR